MLKDKKNIIILLLITIILILLICIMIFKLNYKQKSKVIDFSKLSSTELLEMFEDEGYQIELKSFSDLPSTVYIIFRNKTEGIIIQRIYDTYVGNQMTFYDDSINDEIADLLYYDRNDTEGKKQQYKAYQSWLNNYNISKIQLSNMLDEYYEKNADKIKIIDMSEFL